MILAVGATKFDAPTRRVSVLLPPELCHFHCSYGFARRNGDPVLLRLYRLTERVAGGGFSVFLAMSERRLDRLISTGIFEACPGKGRPDGGVLDMRRLLSSGPRLQGA